MTNDNLSQRPRNLLSDTQTRATTPLAAPDAPRRLICPCSVPPVLLATIEDGNVNLKIRDRYYHIEGVHGRLRATCPRCGKEHIVPLGTP